MAMSADPGRNLLTAITRVTEAAKLGAAVVCLPELFRSRYFAQREDASLFDLAEPVPGPSTERTSYSESVRHSPPRPSSRPSIHRMNELSAVTRSRACLTAVPAGTSNASFAPKRA